ncbi:hypothetical protein BGZ70_002187 [Mortierella alpina]|uniref:Uncharacterized protein n=1 Tax=Mortierella alpina TaxID=64518 RepID=A0A9P6JBH7_MORAP|nr:hypothetical protein BGZ70_002187 [Mortierella alpina]
MTVDSVQAYRIGTRVKQLPVQISSDGVQFCFLEDVEDAFGIESPCQFEVENLAVMYLRDANHQRFNPKRLPVFPDKIIDIVHCTAFTTHGARSSLDTNAAQAVAKEGLEHGYEQHDSDHAIDESVDKVFNKTAFQKLLAQNADATANSDDPFQEHMVRNLNTLIKLSAGMDSKMDILQQLASLTVKLQQEANNRLVLIQNKAEAILVQNFELLEYTVPRLFIILPEPTSAWDKLRMSKNKFRLHFICECGDHTMSGSTNIPHHLHLALHDGYEIRQPYEFFQKYGAFILFMLELLKFGANVAGFVVPMLASLKVTDMLDGVGQCVGSTAKLTAEGVDQSISFLEGLRDGKFETGEPVDASSNQVTIRQAMMSAEGVEGVDLRQLRSYLQENRGDNLLGNLYRMSTATGHVKWVCREHYRSGYQEAASEELRELLKAQGGCFEEQLGRVVVTISSSVSAIQLYAAILKARGVFELELVLSWNQTFDDLKRLRKLIASSSIASLTLHFMRHTGPQTDFNIRGRRRYDPVFELMQQRVLQEVRLRSVPMDLFERCNGFTGSSWPNLKCLELDMVIATKKDLGRMGSLLSKSTGMQQLALWANKESIAPLITNLSTAFAVNSASDLVVQFRDPGCGALDDLWLQLSIPRKDGAFRGATCFDFDGVLKAYRRHIEVLWVILEESISSARTPHQQPQPEMTTQEGRQLSIPLTSFMQLINQCPSLHRLDVVLPSTLSQSGSLVVNAVFELARKGHTALDLTIFSSGKECSKQIPSHFKLPSHSLLLKAGWTNGRLTTLKLPELSFQDTDIEISESSALTDKDLAQPPADHCGSYFLRLLFAHSQHLPRLTIDTTDTDAAFRIVAESRTRGLLPVSVYFRKGEDLMTSVASEPDGVKDDTAFSTTATWDGIHLVDIDCPQRFVPIAKNIADFAPTLQTIDVYMDGTESRVAMSTAQLEPTLQMLDFQSPFDSSSIEIILYRASTIRHIRIRCEQENILEAFKAVRVSQAHQDSEVFTEFCSLDNKYRVEAHWSGGRMVKLNTLSWHHTPLCQPLLSNHLSVSSLRIYRLESYMVNPDHQLGNQKETVAMNQQLGNLREIVAVNHKFDARNLCGLLRTYRQLNSIDLSIKADMVQPIFNAISKARTPSLPILNVSLRIYRHHALLKAKWSEDRMTMLDTTDWPGADVAMILGCKKRKADIEELTVVQLTPRLCAVLADTATLGLRSLTVNVPCEDLDNLWKVLCKAPYVRVLSLAVHSRDFAVFIDTIFGTFRSINDICITMVSGRNPMRLSARHGSLAMLDCVGWVPPQLWKPNHALVKHFHGLEVVWLDSFDQLDINRIFSSTDATHRLKELVVRQQCPDIATLSTVLERTPELSSLEVNIPDDSLPDFLFSVKSSRFLSNSTLEILVKASSTIPTGMATKYSWKGIQLLRLVCSYEGGELLHLQGLKRQQHGLGLFNDLEDLELRTPIMDLKALGDLLVKLPRLKRLVAVIDQDVVDFLGTVARSRAIGEGESILAWVVSNRSGTARMTGTWTGKQLTTLDATDWSLNGVTQIINSHGPGLRALCLFDTDEDVLWAITGTVGHLQDLTIRDPNVAISKLDHVFAANPDLATIQLFADEDAHVTVMAALVKLRERFMPLKVVLRHPVHNRLWFQTTLSPSYNEGYKQPTQPEIKTYASVDRILLGNEQLIIQYRGWQSLVDSEGLALSASLSIFTASSTLDIGLLDVPHAVKQTAAADRSLRFVDLQMEIHKETTRSIMELVNWGCLETLSLTDFTSSPDRGFEAVYNGLAAGGILKELTYYCGVQLNDKARELLCSIVRLQPLERIAIQAQMDAPAVLDLLACIHFERLRHLSINAKGFSVDDVQDILDRLSAMTTILETLVLQYVKLHPVDVVRMRAKGIRLLSGCYQAPATLPQ